MTGDKLTDYPCAIELDAAQEEWTQACQEDCSIADTCVARRIYNTCIMLRRAHKAHVAPTRAVLNELPCYHASHDPGYMCSAECRDRVDTGEWRCVVLPIYRENIKLRADMRKLTGAVLGDMTAEVATKLYLRAALMSGTVERVNAMAHLNILADSVAKL